MKPELVVILLSVFIAMFAFAFGYGLGALIAHLF
jgi:hypothetical protein